jgi:hypothetical protein
MLAEMDEENFNKEKTAMIYDTTTDYIIKLYEESFNTEPDDVRPHKKRHLDPLSTSSAASEALPNCELDEFTIQMYQKIQAASVSGDSEKLDCVPQQLEKKRREFRNTISRQVEEYVYYCQHAMDVANDLKECYGNDCYQKEKATIVFQRITYFKDAYYAFKFFDLYKWWHVFGKKRWPEMATAASIMLGKPTHNGFQERVFSRGTYTDTKTTAVFKREEL